MKFLDTIFASAEYLPFLGNANFWYVRFLKSESVTPDTNLAIGCRRGSGINKVELVPKTLNPKIKQDQE